MNRDVCEHGNPEPCGKCMPEALRLADWLDNYRTTPVDALAAAELRRLHAERSAADEIIADLMDALKRLHDATRLVSKGHYNEELHDIAVSKARAVIKKAEGQA
jgi:hypothetical protein